MTTTLLQTLAVFGTCVIVLVLAFVTGRWDLIVIDPVIVIAWTVYALGMKPLGRSVGRRRW